MNAFALQRLVPAFQLPIGLDVRLHFNLTLKNDDFASLIRTIPGTDCEFELITHKQAWGEERVFFQDEAERLLALPAAWTDVVAPAPFVLAASGRSLFRTQDLWELVRIVRQGKS